MLDRTRTKTKDMERSAKRRKAPRVSQNVAGGPRFSNHGKVDIRSSLTTRVDRYSYMEVLLGVQTIHMLDMFAGTRVTAVLS